MADDRSTSAEGTARGRRGRNLPRLLRAAVEMVRAADRRRAVENYAFQLFLGVATGIQLLITRILIAAVIDTRVAGFGAAPDQLALGSFACQEEGTTRCQQLATAFRLLRC